METGENKSVSGVLSGRDDGNRRKQKCFRCPFRTGLYRTPFPAPCAGLISKVASRPPASCPLPMSGNQISFCFKQGPRIYILIHTVASARCWSDSYVLQPFQ